MECTRFAKNVSCNGNKNKEKRNIWTSSQFTINCSWNTTVQSIHAIYCHRIYHRMSSNKAQRIKWRESEIRASEECVRRARARKRRRRKNSRRLLIHLSCFELFYIEMFCCASLYIRLAKIACYIFFSFHSVSWVSTWSIECKRMSNGKKVHII